MPATFRSGGTTLRNPSHVLLWRCGERDTTRDRGCNSNPSPLLPSAASLRTLRQATASARAPRQQIAALSRTQTLQTKLGIIIKSETKIFLRNRPLSEQVGRC